MSDYNPTCESEYESDCGMETQIKLTRENKNEMGKWNQIIDTVNNLQTYCRKINKSNINFPEIVVIGSQSSGKSSILERIIYCDILPKNKETCTKCPIIMQLSPKTNQDEIKAVFLSDNNLSVKGEINIRKKILEITNELQGFSEIPITIKLSQKHFPRLTLVDLPGLIRNSLTGNESDVDSVEKLTEKFVNTPNSVILAVSAANVDLANSDSIKMSRKFDPEGKRTFHIITKIDLMDKGTDARDILSHELLSKSLGMILLKNRNQMNLMNNISNASVHESEQNFLKMKYPEISKQHGIDVLICKLEEIFHNEIKSFLPKIREDLENSIRERESELKQFDISDSDKSLKNYINKYIRKYEEIIKGNKGNYDNEIIGGALISIKIYDEFEKQINDLKIDDYKESYLRTLIRNTAGNMKASYSIEKAYLNLSKKQIVKFVNPIEKTLRDVKYLLKGFVEEAINDANISEYYQLKIFLKEKMKDFLENHFEYTDKIIKELIKCEKRNVFCEYPINQPLQLSNNNSENYSEDTKLKHYEDDFQINSEGKSEITKSDGTLKADIDQKDQNPKLIIKMLKDNFKAVQQNIICNFPKWIQKFMIKDLLKSMKALSSESNLDASHLLRFNEKHENRLKIIKDEIKEYEKIRSQLNEYIKSL